MPLYADSNYSFNPWMRDVLPQMQPDLEGIALTESEMMIEALLTQAPIPPQAPIQPRFGAVRHEMEIQDVLGVEMPAVLSDTAVRQESGQPGTLRDSLPGY